MNRTRTTHSPSTPPPTLPPGMLAITPSLPIAKRGDRPAVRSIALTCRPTLGETADSPNAWTATLVWGDRERDPNAPQEHGLGLVESAALEGLLFGVHYLHSLGEITADEVNVARMAIYARLAILESLRNPLLAADLLGLSALLAEQLATGTMGESLESLESSGVEVNL